MNSKTKGYINFNGIKYTPVYAFALSGGESNSLDISYIVKDYTGRNHVLLNYKGEINVCGKDKMEDLIDFHNIELVNMKEAVKFLD